MKLDVYSSKGSKTKKSVDLDDAVFGIEPNDHAIYLDVKRFLAAQRQGTHDTLNRSLVTGSTRKIKKQRERVLHVRAASRTHCSAVVVPCLVQNHATTRKIERQVEEACP